MAKIMGIFLIYFPNQSARVTRKNIALAYPNASVSQRSILVRDSLRELCGKFFDLITTWVKSVDYSYRQVSQVSGFHNFNRKLESNPHLSFTAHR